MANEKWRSVAFKYTKRERKKERRKSFYGKVNKNKQSAQANFTKLAGL